jgi:drug/metabolite transporter (DMT)-like permease
MAVAGVAWGVYTLRGRGTAQPLIATSRNFLRAVPFALAVSLILMSRRDLSARGAFLAIASGALASGVGYVLWYAALRGLSATRAATVQLSVPVIAALGGVLFLAETISPRLVGAGVLILGGVGLALADRARKSH